MEEFNTALPENWQQSLPEEIRNSGVLAEVKDVAAIAKMAVDGRNLAADHVKIPGESATPETRQAFLDDMMTKVPELVAVPKDGSKDAFYKRLGRPEAATGYDLGEIPETVKEKFTGLAAKAFELGMSNDQMKGIAETLVGDFNTGADAQKLAQETEQATMKQAWGQTYDSKLTKLSHFAKQTGFTDDFVSAVGAGEIEAVNMQALDKIMGGYEGGGIEIGKQPGDPGSGVTPMQAETQLEEIMGNKDSAYYDVSNPAHKTTVQKVHELVIAAESGKKQTETDQFRDALKV